MLSLAPEEGDEGFPPLYEVVQALVEVVDSCPRGRLNLPWQDGFDLSLPSDEDGHGCSPGDQVDSGVWRVEHLWSHRGGGGETTALDEETSLSGLPTRNGV